MRNLEFLPDSYVRRIRRRRLNRSNTFWAIAVLVALLGLHIVNESHLRTAQAALKAMRDDAVERQHRQARYSALVQQRRQLESREAIISTLDDDAPLDAVIAEVTGLMPDEMSLCSFMLKVEPLAVAPTEPTPQKKGKDEKPDRVTERGPTRVTLVGRASSDMQVGMFVGRLTASPLFAEVNLQFSRDSESTVRPQRMFGLDFLVNRVEAGPPSGLQSMRPGGRQ